MSSVLVVDDEPGILEALVEVLCDEGFSVTSARNGQEALQRLAETKPDLVILDYMMPVMDGAETWSAMQASPELRDIPVLIASAVSRSSLPAGCRPAGFLAKPFQLEELFAMVGQLLGRSS